MTGAFHQAYDPVAGSVLLSALVAALPLVVLAVLLAVVRAAPWKAAVAGATTAFALAWLVWRMPIGLAVAAATHGMAFGLWPISWVVLNAVFFYNLTVASGDFDVIRRSLARLTDDRRIQALLVAFCFGALVEGIAGFGAPVAISAAMLAGLGFEPVAGRRARARGQHRPGGLRLDRHPGHDPRRPARPDPRPRRRRPPRATCRPWSAASCLSSRCSSPPTSSCCSPAGGGWSRCCRPWSPPAPASPSCSSPSRTSWARS